jgi:Flp pilus assembly secretin CpaC
VPFVRLFIAFVCAAALVHGAQSAEQYCRDAQKAEKSGDVVAAYLLYARAAALDRNNVDYWAKMTALRPVAEVQSKRPIALTPEGIADKESARLPLDAAEGFEPFTRKDLEDLERMAPPPHLAPSPGAKTFHLRGNPKDLFERVASAMGYIVIFDREYAPTTTVRFDIEDVNYREALQALEQATDSFIIPLSGKVMLVAQDTANKRTELEPNEAQALPIPERISIQEAQEIAMAIQQTLEIRRVALDPQKRLLYVRDRASKVELAKALAAELSYGRAQVSIGLQMLSVARNTSLDFGIRLPTSFPLVNFGDLGHSTPVIPAGFTRFLTFGGGATFFGIGITDAQAFATASRGEAASLLESTLTALDGQPVSFHVGDKYPILTGGYIGSGGLGPGQVTHAVISTASYADFDASQVSTTGNLSLVINGQSIPLTLAPAANNLAGLQNSINFLQAGVGAQIIRRGTASKPYSLLVAASTLSITSIQLIDDPAGAKIELLKTPDIVSAITSSSYATADATAVSKTGALSLSVGSQAHPLSLTSATNNLNGLRDAINAANAGVTAAVLTTGIAPTPFYLQVVAKSAGSGAIQIYDDPSGANTPLLSLTDEVNAGQATGITVPGSVNFGQVYTPPPTFVFEDLGLVLKITPWVHNRDEISLEIEAEFKVLGNGNFNGVPVISNRKYQGKARLRAGEWAVVAGLVSDSQTRSLNGLAGLMNIPFFGALFRETSITRQSNDVLLVIKPEVTRMPPSEIATKPLYFGTETRPVSLL